jgi:hypothetical protein
MVILLKNTVNDFGDVEPKEFFDFACELEEIKEDLNSTESAVNRSIYMRIYYAVFLFLREWLKKNTSYYSWPKGEHSRLANYIRFKGPFTREINLLIYRKLIRLKKLRHQADYKLNVPDKDSADYEKWDFTSITSAFEIAEDIIETFKGL